MSQKDIEGKEADENEIIVPGGDWEEQEDADFFKFVKHGDKLEGMLVDKGYSDHYGFGLYDLKLPDGTTKRFHGSSQLDSLMKGINEMDYIKIEYIDEQKLPQGSLKLFKVQKKGN